MPQSLFLDCTSDTLKRRTCRFPWFPSCSCWPLHNGRLSAYTMSSKFNIYRSGKLGVHFIRKARWSTRRDQSLQLCIPCEISNSLLSPSRGVEIKEPTCCTCVKACGGCWGGISITMFLELPSSRGVQAVVGRGLYDLLHLGRLVGGEWDVAWDSALVGVLFMRKSPSLWCLSHIASHPSPSFTERYSLLPTCSLIRSRQSWCSLSDFDCTKKAGTRIFTPAWSRITFLKRTKNLIEWSLLFKNMSAPRLWKPDNLNVNELRNFLQMLSEFEVSGAKWAMRMKMLFGWEEFI